MKRLKRNFVLLLILMLVLISIEKNIIISSMLSASGILFAITLYKMYVMELNIKR